MNVIEVSDQTFEADVIRRSYEVPVVVDFWAPWCGPCRVLGPVLEGLANESNGEWLLAKIDTDANQAKAQEYRIQGIPNVKAFVNGKVVDEFSGALPKHMIEQWLAKVIPSAEDKELAAARGYLADHQLAKARAIFERLNMAEDRNLEAMIGLAEVAIGECLDGEESKFAEAVQILESITDAEEALIEQDYARVWLLVEGYRQLSAARERWGGDPRTSLSKEIESSPRDPEFRWMMAMIEGAAGEKERALQHLLEIVKFNRGFRDDGARVAMVRIFKILGDDDPLTHRYRQELGRWLY